MKRFSCSVMFRGGTVALIVLVSLAIASAQTIITFDPPNSTSTVPRAITLRGQITGYYQNANGTQPGFLRQRDGTFISFEADQTVEHGATFVTDINLEGQITGYMGRAMTTRGFLRQTDGTIIEFIPATTSLAATLGEPAPRPSCGNVAGSAAFAINGVGQITGPRGQCFCSGFLRQPDGTMIDVNVPGPLLTSTSPQAINLLGQIAGYYQVLFADFSYGFLRQRNGTFITFDPPNSHGTTPQAISLLGQITGYYEDTNNVVHGFLRKPNGTIITFDPAGSIGTWATAINLEDQIVGYYATADGIYHGFLRQRNGRIETFDSPGVGNGGTFPADINDLSQIVGYYQDANFALHGFVRSGH